MADDNREQEIWTYAGVRVGKGRKYYAWQRATGGELLFFAKISGGSVGSRYSFDVLRGEDGSFQSVYGGSKQYVNATHEDADLTAGWQTESRLAEISLARDRAERKASAQPDALDQALQPLRDLRAKSCRTRADRVAFLALVIEGLDR